MTATDTRLTYLSPTMYTSAPSIVIRASDNADPTAIGYEELEIAVKIPDFDPAPVGEDQGDIAYNERAPKLSRRRFDFSCMPMYVHSGQGSNFQTVAVIQKLWRLWSTYEYMWLYHPRLKCQISNVECQIRKTPGFPHLTFDI